MMNTESYVLPNAVDLEQGVLGACIGIGGSMDEVVDLLRSECFFDNKHRMIWDALSELYQEGKPIDLLMVKRRLDLKSQTDKVGGAYYLTELTSKISSNSNIHYHARVLLEQYLKRELIRLSNNNVQLAFDETNDVFDLYQKAFSQLEGTLNGAIKYDVKPIGEIHQEVVNESRKVAYSGSKSGIPTGYRNLDNFTNGWQKSDLVILAGRPSMGKSVCGLSFVINPALKENIPTAIFSLEMSAEQLVGRVQSNLSYYESSRVIKKQLDISEVDLLEQRCKELNNAPVYIDDTPNLSFLELKGKARKLVKEKGVRLIVIDYLQLMTIESKKTYNREQEVSQISKGLKGLAKELDIPIIALSQLNRMVEGRSDKRPNLSDLRESGSIEQDADLVVFCYRPEYYEIPTYELGGETLNSEGLMILIVAKHRSGSLGELRFGFNGNLTKLENYDTFISNRQQSQPQGFRIQPNRFESNADHTTGGEETDSEHPF